ncbi:MAG: LytR C-terminal domain-containing protein [Candidatus Kryptonium sp.]|nr:LytR C-terminal domain-containing protein [Candidatus Kryptonium sp.]
MRSKKQNIFLFVTFGATFLTGLILLILKILSANYKFSNEEEITVNNPSYQIDVLNACGVEEIAFQITQYLRTKGFDVIDYGNYGSVVNESFVIDRVGKPDTAKLIARALGIKEDRIIRSKAKYYNEFTIVIGKDYMSLKPFKNKREEDF